MRKKTNLLAILSFFFFLHLAVGQKANLQGKITDVNTGEALLSATVFFGEKGTISDFDGNYAIELDAGEYDMTISFIGYEEIVKQVVLKAGESQTLNIELNPASTILQTATVTSGKYEKPLGEVTVSLEVLKPRLIDNTNQIALDDAIQKIPGVTVIDGQANIRGGSGFSNGAGSRVLLLVDEVPILQPDSGFPNWEDIPMESVEQIEVLKGAASALYGSAALNGIINVRTAYAKLEPETNASAFYTTVFEPKRKQLKWWDSAPNIIGASLAHRQKFNKFDLVVSSYYLKESHYRKDHDREYGRFNFSTRYRITDRLSVSLNGNFNKGRRDSYFYWESDTTAYVGSPSTLSSNDRFRWNIDPNVTYYDKGGNRHRLIGRFYRVDNNISGNRSNQSWNLYGEYQFQRKFEALDLVLSAGVVGLGSSIEAELYGDTTYTSRNFAGYVQADKKFSDKFNVSFGFRYENNLLNNPGSVGNCPFPPSEEQESKPVIRIGASYQASEATFIRASWGQGYRYPTIAEKYIFTDVGGFSVIPNPSLQSETGWSGEVGIKQGFRVGNFEGFLDIAAFLMKYRDMMEFNLINPSFRPPELICDNVGIGFSSVNIGGTEIKGLEFSLAGRGEIFGMPTNLLAGYYYIDPRFEEFDNTPIEPGEEGTTGQRNANNSSSDENILKYRSQHSFKVDIEMEVLPKFTFGVSSTYNSNLDAIDAIFELIVPGLKNYREVHYKGYHCA